MRRSAWRNARAPVIARAVDNGGREVTKARPVVALKRAAVHRLSGGASRVETTNGMARGGGAERFPRRVSISNSRRVPTTGVTAPVGDGIDVDHRNMTADASATTRDVPPRRGRGCHPRRQ